MTMAGVGQKGCVVLGVDPGTRVAGYGIMRCENRRVILLDHGALEMASTVPLYQRVGRFHRFFDEKIKLHGVGHLVLETPFLGKNAQNFLKLGYLRGILYLLQDAHALSLAEFSPAEIKRSITGSGAADKEQVARVVMRLFPTLAMPKRLDTTDALAVAVCGVWDLQRQQSGERAASRSVTL